MTGPHPVARSVGAFGLLDDAIDYARSAVQTVSPPLLTSPTPCSEWDLRALLQHLNEALEVLAECGGTGRVNLHPGRDPDGDRGRDPAATFLLRTAAIRDGRRRGRGSRPVTIADRSLTATTVATILAVEIAVHGWDVSQASGQARPIPPALATGLYAVCPLFIDNTTRHGLFASAVEVSAHAGPSDVLVAFLGRVGVG
jgi:uncharacterized protein (TIGR03086 family)